MREIFQKLNSLVHNGIKARDDCGLCGIGGLNVCSDCASSIGYLDGKMKNGIHAQLRKDPSRATLFARVASIRHPSPLREARKVAGLTQQELADRFEVDRSFIAQMETGGRAMPKSVATWADKMLAEKPI